MAIVSQLIFSDVSVETIGYQYATRTSSIQSGNASTLQSYSSLNPQSLFSGRRVISKLANEITAGKTTQMEKAQTLLNWVQLHIRPQTEGPSTVIGDDYVNIVKRGWGYCDQMAHVFATMATFVGLDARQFQLIQDNGVSPHTVAEVKIDERWIVADPWMGIIPTNSLGNGYTVAQMASSVTARKKFGYEQIGLGAATFKNGKRFSTYPYISNLSTLQKIVTKVPRKLINKLKSSLSSPPKQATPSSTSTGTGIGTNTSQAVEVNANWSGKDLLLFDKSRLQQLAFNYADAIQGFESLISTSHNGSVIDSAQYFLALALFDAGHVSKASASLSEIVQKHPKSPWLLGAERIQSEIMLSSGDKQGAILKLKEIPSPQAKLIIKLLQ
jgi:hypothetical protein